MAGSVDEEFTAFVVARWGGLFRTAFLLTGDRATAEDLLQTCLSTTYVSWRRIRDPGAAEAYTRKSLANTMISWRRRAAWQAERPHADVPDTVAVPGRGAQDVVTDHLWVWAAVQSLPARQRAALVLRYYEDLTERQTADLLDCSIGTVKSQVHAALAALRSKLGDLPALELVEDGGLP